MKIGKPDLKTVLSRRRRSECDFFEERKSLGMTLEQVLSEVTKTYSLSPESLKVLESIFAQKKESTKKVTEPEKLQNTTIQTNDDSEENDNEEPEEELLTNSENKQTNKPQVSKKKSKQQNPE